MFGLRRQKTKIIIIFIASIALLLAALYFFIFTRQGAVLITSFGIKHYAKTDESKINVTQGNLAQGITYYNLELNNIKFLPKGSVVKIQQLDVGLDSFKLAGLKIKVKNARLSLPGIDPVLFYGAYENNILDISVYAKLLRLRAIFDALPAIKGLKNIRGIIEDCDFRITGEVFAPNIAGTLFIRELTWNQFVMRACPVALNLEFSDIQKDLKIKGKVSFKSGELLGKKTALIKLQDSNIVFIKDPAQPIINISGSSVVEKTKINIIAKGKIQSPEIILNSEPVLAKDKLVVMLATNQSWKGVSGSLENSRISSELSADLVNYFLFGRAGNKIAKLLGVDSVSIKYDGKTKEAEITKEISSSTGIKYGVEQKNAKQENERVSQKIGIDQKISDAVSLEAEKKIDNGEKNNPSDNGETNLWLKFKKGF
ncbi:MAG: translocation/assembly module TamB domain-containing protein [Candidatus Omnitrophota bacterium]